MNISVDQINAFLESANKIFEQMCGYTLKKGTLTRDNLKLNQNELFIMLGITGELSGQVCIAFNINQGKDIASKMMFNTPVPELDDMAKSALSELGNMIMGNAATILSKKNIGIDITTPSLCFGQTEMVSPNVVSIKVPLEYENGTINMFFLLKMK